MPHSEIPGSTIARISPGLFAACHALHRLSVPRHPPDALLLRSCATPNGKGHQISVDRVQISEGSRRCGKRFSHRRHFMRDRHSPGPSPGNTIPRPQPKGRAQIPRGHATRFFTMCHQPRPQPRPKAAAAGNRVLLAAFRSQISGLWSLIPDLRSLSADQWR